MESSKASELVEDFGLSEDDEDTVVDPNDRDDPFDSDETSEDEDDLQPDDRYKNKGMS